MSVKLCNAMAWLEAMAAAGVLPIWLKWRGLKAGESLLIGVSEATAEGLGRARGLAATGSKSAMSVSINIRISVLLRRISKRGGRNAAAAAEESAARLAAA
jgi:hypothetical protein